MPRARCSDFLGNVETSAGMGLSAACGVFTHPPEESKYLIGIADTVIAAVNWHLVFRTVGPNDDEGIDGSFLDPLGSRDIGDLVVARARPAVARADVDGVGREQQRSSFGIVVIDADQFLGFVLQFIGRAWERRVRLDVLKPVEAPEDSVNA